MRAEEKTTKIPDPSGSLDTLGLAWTWHYDKKNHDLIARFMPEKNPETREETLLVLADRQLSKPEYQHWYHHGEALLIILAILCISLPPGG